MRLIARKVISHTLFIIALTLSPVIFADNEGGNLSNTSASDYAFFTPGSLKWNKAPDVLPKGAMLAVLEGDPSKEGPFTMRLKLPANYQINAHSHPGVEHITVISGEFYVGLGKKIDHKKANKLSTGSFAYLKPGTYHYAFTKTPAIIQLHGIGPWGIDFIKSQEPSTNSNQ